MIFISLLTLVSLILCVTTSHFKVLLVHNSKINSMFGGLDKRGYPIAEIRTDSGFGGFARISAELKKIRQEAASKNISVLFINTGDTFVGTDYYYMYGVPMVVEMMNMLHFNIVALGDNELTLDINNTIQFINLANFPIIATNVREGRFEKLQKSHVMQVGIHKIGFVSYLHSDENKLSRAYGIMLDDAINEIISESKYLRALGVNTIIAIGTTRIEIDKQILEYCNDIDLLISGSGKLLWNGPHPLSEEIYGSYPLMYSGYERKVPIISVPGATKYLGLLTISVHTVCGAIEAWEGNPRLLDANTSLDEDVVAVLEPYQIGVNMVRQWRTGYTKVLLEVSDGICRKQECNFGNLLCDALVDHAVFRYEGPYWTNVAVAMTASGRFGENIYPGPVTKSDLIQALSYEQKIKLITIRGKYLFRILIHALKRYPITSKKDSFYGAEFLQYSGIMTIYDLRRTPNKRLLYAYIKCANCLIPDYFPLEQAQYYNVIINEYLWEGGEGFIWFKKYGELLEEYELTDMKILSSYFEKYNIVYPAVEDRIILNSTPGKNIFYFVQLFFNIYILCFLYAS